MKKRFIACVVACAMLLMGTGYAYWTDLINLSATAKSGYLDVDFTAAEARGNNFKPVEGGLEAQTAYDKTLASVKETNPDYVSFGLDNLYPGYYQNYTTTVQNFGTVAAKLGAIDMTVSGSNDATLEMIGVNLSALSTYTTDPTEVPNPNDPIYGEWKYQRDGWCVDPICKRHDKHEGVWPLRVGYFKVREIIGYNDMTVPGSPTTNPVNINFGAEDVFTIGTGAEAVTFVRLSALVDKEVNITEAISNMLYVTNDSSMSFLLGIGMDPDAKGIYTTGSAQLRNPKGNYDANTQNANGYINFALAWDQYNEQ